MTARFQVHQPFVLLRCVLALAVCLFGLGFAAATAARAATVRLVAGGGSDTGNCSASPCATISYAIGQSTSGDTVSVGPGTYTQLGITVDKDLTISGAGAVNTTVRAAATPKTAADRVFLINDGVTATIQNIAIINGNSGPGSGGGIRNNGTLAVVNSIISGNSTSADAVGGGIFSIGLMAVTNSTITGNYSGMGGAIFNAPAAVSMMTIVSSTLSGNSARYLGGGIDNAGTLGVIDSTISNNTDGGYGNDGGGGIFNAAIGTLTITNSTLSGNMVTLSFGRGGGISNEGTLTINNSTLGGNTTSGNNNGGGISNLGSATLKNTIVANSPHGGNCDNAVASNGHNFSSDATCSFSQTGDINSKDPLLGPLAGNGGPTLTQELLPGSPAIDAGDNSGCPATDQRGIARPLGAACDIGAYEALLYKIYAPLVLR